MKEKRTRRADGNPAYLAMSFRMSPELKEQLREVARKNNTSSSQMLKRLIEEKHRRLFK